MVSSTFANLTGSTFEGNDGNLVVNGAGNHDWQNAPNRVRGDDLASGKSDNSFGQGTKEDDPNVTVVTGSIPPQKSDLTRFYVASEFVSGSNFLYLAWERSNVLGSANMDFELNQSTQPDLTTTGAKTLVRTAGDILITFDFGGSGAPTLGLLKWVTSGPTSQCFSSNALPCWGNRVDLSAAGFAEGAVNTVTVSDGIAGVSLPADTFGEAAVNLTAANVFPAGTCEAFGSAFLKSRSSASFPAEVKDFVAPQPVNISNCGTITIVKDAVPNDAQDFSYTSTVPSHTSFALDDDSDNTLPNTVTFNNVQAGSYTVTEASTAGWDFTSLVCTATGTGTSAAQAGSTPTANITLGAGGTATCTYTNTRQLGAIKVTKQSVKGNAPLGGATFTVAASGFTTRTITTGSDGTACTDNLPFGSYTVTETGAPTGYNIDNPNGVSVTVDHNATCSTGTPNAPASAFSDTPLSKIQVVFTSLAGAGVTNASIVCKLGANTVDPISENGSADPAFDDTDETITNLQPGTYVCTVVVDP